METPMDVERKIPDAPPQNVPGWANCHCAPLCRVPCAVCTAPAQRRRNCRPLRKGDQTPTPTPAAPRAFPHPRECRDRGMHTAFSAPSAIGRELGLRPPPRALPPLPRGSAALGPQPSDKTVPAPLRFAFMSSLLTAVVTAELLETSPPAAFGPERLGRPCEAAKI